MFTPQELNQYIRLTLKQHNLLDISFSFKKMDKTLGYFHAEKNEIVFSLNALQNFTRFKNCLLHEMSHALQYKELGTFKTPSGRNDFHGKTFKKYCRLLDVSSSRFIA